jgi:CPA1 family monovalent cation:H+ antiporter
MNNQVEILLVLLVVTLVVAIATRPLRLPYTLALVIVGLMLGFSGIFPDVRLDPESVLFLFLPALLFEGSWSLSLADLAARWIPIFLLAVPGLVISIVVTGIAMHLGMGWEWSLAFLLGAIISPTDPVAVLALFRQLGLPARLRTIIEGESLFNDGLGATAFTVLLAVVLFSQHLAPTLSLAPWHLGLTILWLMLGGTLIGALLGLGVGYLLRYLDDHLIETTVTLCLAYGAFILGQLAQTSGLLAVVGAGLVTGTYGRQTGMSERTQEVTQTFWEVVGYLANSLLFLLVGIQIGANGFAHDLLGIAWAVGGVLMGRLVMIYGQIPVYHRWLQKQGRLLTEGISRSWQVVLLFSGLRGALSLALVLSLPEMIPQRTRIQGIVYGVVLVTLLGQGIGLRVALPRWHRKKPAVRALSTPLPSP